MIRTSRSTSALSFATLALLPLPARAAQPATGPGRRRLGAFLFSRSSAQGTKRLLASTARFFPLAANVRYTAAFALLDLTERTGKRIGPRRPSPYRSHSLLH